MTRACACDEIFVQMGWGGHQLGCPKGRAVDTARRIAVDPCSPPAAAAASPLCLLGAADDWHVSWLVPPPAVWSLNGEPMLP